MGSVIEQFLAAHEHTGCTETTMNGIMVKEGFLKRMKLFPLRQPLNCKNFLAVDLGDKNETGIYRMSIHQNCASSAFAYLASPLRAGQTQLIAKEVEERHVRANINLV